MPSPVSCFSPFTPGPFTPSANAGSGGYFDRPMNVASPLSRRPGLGSHSCSSSNSTRLNRVSAAIDSPRQPTENGWRIATRMREEALIAWEQQVKNTTSNSISLQPRQFSPNLTAGYTQLLGETSQDNPHSSASGCSKQTLLPSHPTILLARHAQVAKNCSDDFEKITTPNLQHLTSSLDPSPNRNRLVNSANIMGNQLSCLLKK